MYPPPSKKHTSSTLPHGRFLGGGGNSKVAIKVGATLGDVPSQVSSSLFLHDNGPKIFRTPNFGHSDFFRSFCTKMVPKNSKCPILAILSSSSLFAPKWSERFGMHNFGHSKFLPVFLHQKALG